METQLSNVTWDGWSGERLTTQTDSEKGNTKDDMTLYVGKISDAQHMMAD